MTVNNTDTFLVERSGTSYKLQAQNLMADLQDTDLMLVERSGTSYKATGLDIKNSLGSDQPTLKATASGAISNGDTCVLNSNGTVSAISSTVLTESATDIGADLSTYNDKEPAPVVYDPATGRIIAVRDDSQQIRVRVGRFNSGSTAITWGSWQQAYSAGQRNIKQYRSAAYWDDNSNQLLVFFMHNSGASDNKMRLIVRSFNSSDQVQGTAGDDYSFSGNYPNPYQKPTILRATVDPTRFHIFWQKQSGGNYDLWVNTYTVGANSVSRPGERQIHYDYNYAASIDPYGNIVVCLPTNNDLRTFTTKTNSAKTSVDNLSSSVNISPLSNDPSGSSNDVRLAWDSGNQGFWITARYFQYQWSNYARNTYIGFFKINAGGAPFMVAAGDKFFDGMDPSYHLTYHAPSRSVIAAYGGGSSSEASIAMKYKRAYLDSNGNIATTNTFTPNLHNGSSTKGARSIDASLYIPSIKKFLTFHIDVINQGLSHFDRDINLYQPGYEDSNLTTSNYLGIADGSAANNTDAKVIVYPGVAGGQSGLTTGTKYYVQLDGTLDTTADDIVQVAGTAQSASTIKVQYS